MHPFQAFRQEVLAALHEAAKRLGIEDGLPALESPPDAAMGDLAMPCFPLARALRKAPPAIAAELAEATTAAGWIHEVRAIGPYVNFFIDKARLAAGVLADPAAALRAEAKPGRILLEHTSANPNGPLHVGRARNPILGDTLGRILRAAGHDVETQYYMDNLGRQVALLYYGKTHIEESSLEPAERQKDDHLLVRYYQAANDRMKNDEAVAQEIKELVAHLEEAPAELLVEVRKVYEACFAGMRQSLERLGVTYDSIKDESDLVTGGHVQQTIQALQDSPRWAQEDDGANYLDLSAELKGNKSTKFFFTRKDGTSVYATRDVAYHKWKAEQVGEDGLLLNVLGEDHRLQSLQVGVALEELGHPRPEVVFYAFVSLPEGKMSTRVGRVVFLDDLLDQAVELAHEAVQERRGEQLEQAQIDAIAEAVGIAAIRFNIARVQPEKPIAFRWEDALDFDGGAPYIMYAHARACSLLRKAAKQNIAEQSATPGAGEQKLLSKIAQWVPALEEAAAARAPHRACSMALELAAAFNEYYRDHPVVDCEDDQVQALRYQTVDVARLALRACHDALGLPVLDEM